jgi:hypothetical protein
MEAAAMAGNWQGTEVTEIVGCRNRSGRVVKASNRSGACQTWPSLHLQVFPPDGGNLNAADRIPQDKGQAFSVEYRQTFDGHRMHGVAAAGSVWPQAHSDELEVGDCSAAAG